MSREAGWIATAVFAVSTVWATGVLVATHIQERPPSAEEAAIAIHVARGDGYRSPMDMSASAPESAWSPPVYPTVMAGIFRVFGVQSAPAVNALALLNASGFGFICALAVLTGHRLFGSWTAGLTAAVMLCLDPLFLIAVGDFWDGIVALAIFAGVLAVAVGSLPGLFATNSSRSSVAFGLGLGILALTNTSYVTAFPALGAAWIGTRDGTHWRQHLAAIALACSFVVAPWTARNLIALRHFVPIRTGAGVQFWIGNPPISSGWLDERAYAMHPYRNADERRTLLDIGEPSYNTLTFNRFRENALQAPGAFVISCVRRFVYVIAGRVDSASSEQPIALIVLGLVIAAVAGLGMVSCLGRGLNQHWLPAIALSLTLPFIPTAVIDRYRLPVRYILILYCGAAVTWVARRNRADQMPPKTVAGRRAHRS